MLPDAICMIRFARPSQYVDMLRSYKLFINRVEVGSISRNAVLDLAVPSGPLTIEARLDWGTSQPLRIDAAPNRNIEIEVSNHWGALLSLWAVTFGRRSYLKLVRRNSG
jgi:hypothetical protein